jgi:hypothetical protein
MGKDNQDRGDNYERPGPISENFGGTGETTIKLRFLVCGSRDVSTKPEHMPGGVVAWRMKKARG